jgi:hypothetical protein
MAAQRMIMVDIRKGCVVKRFVADCTGPVLVLKHYSETFWSDTVNPKAVVVRDVFLVSVVPLAGLSSSYLIAAAGTRCTPATPLARHANLALYAPSPTCDVGRCDHFDQYNTASQPRKVTTPECYLSDLDRFTGGVILTI